MKKTDLLLNYGRLDEDKLNILIKNACLTKFFDR